MAVFRIEKTRDYTVMSNYHLREMSLSLKAKGLLSLMLSLPENWDYTMKGLARICKDGIDSISGGIRELEAHGYLVRARVRGANGQLGSIEYTILEQPKTPSPAQEEPIRENPVQANPILLRDPLTASYFVAVWKMLRKKGCVPSALTQNVKDLLASREIENILDNTDFMVLLSQAQSDRAILAKQLGISEHQLSYITHSNSGEGLLFYGNVTIPFVDRFPRGEIYDLLTTRPEDLAHERTDE